MLPKNWAAPPIAFALTFQLYAAMSRRHHLAVFVVEPCAGSPRQSRGKKIGAENYSTEGLSEELARPSTFHNNFSQEA
jgi:hypothetical protein